MANNFDWSDEAVAEYVKQCLDSFKEKLRTLSRVEDLNNLKESLMFMKGLTPEKVYSTDLIVNNNFDLYMKIDIISIRMIDAEIQRRLSEQK